MKERRIMLMSGFLGSGKTTSMTALAKYLNENGRTACLITNDLGSNLVDTAYVNDNNIPVKEISNGCLCHDVPQLIEKIKKHIEERDSDFIIFEPVGSCVDMVDHVYKDIIENYKDSYVLAPVSAIVDPIRFRKFYINGETGDDIGEKSVSYGFQKQLEEADLLLLNKTDLLSAEEREEIKSTMIKFFPDVPIIEISALKEENIDQWADYITTHESSVRNLDIDMDIIYKGCEYMGWYNKVCTIESSKPVDISEICAGYLEAVKTAFNKEGREILHAKVHVSQSSEFTKAALTSSNGNISVVGSMKEFCGKGTLNVNIRALMMPKPLGILMEEELRKVMDSYSVNISENALQSFLPVEDPPVPTVSI